MNKADTGLPKLNTDLKNIVSSFDKDNKPYKVDAPAQLPNFEINVIGAAIKTEYNQTTIAELSTADSTKVTQLKNDLVEILESHIDTDARKLGGS